ncbi:MAG TPA: dipeptidase [Paraburkholderia sp.]|uniref:dipeptidase n=1 Tax=Paraburkholderia sp. TaxID=1926495 RepID=UPI002B469B25|nr:dipeptidase [Paraburkholderia sp.]HKR43747.1 dipeptidase [Paraburkholderia sp.]
MTSQSAMQLHLGSIVIDAVCPLPAKNPEYLEWYREGGVTTLAPTVASTQDANTALNRIASWHRLLHEREDLLLVRQASDVELAKRNGRLGVYLHFQGTDPIGDNLDLIHVYKALGVGVIQLSYNVRNRVGDGCEESTDAGLSRFGMKLISRLNEARIIVDCSHTGLRTSLDAIERSSAPVVLSHSNVSSVHETPRNVSSELIRAIARSGGVIGVAGFPGMVSDSRRPTLDHFIAHIDAIVECVGIDHVGLGIDYYTGQHGVASDEVAMAYYNQAVRSGIWSTAYPAPPHHYPQGIETPRTLQNLTHRLLEKGYSDSNVRKVLGENWMRVMRTVWG